MPAALRTSQIARRSPGRWRLGAPPRAALWRTLSLGCVFLVLSTLSVAAAAGEPPEAPAAPETPAETPPAPDTPPAGEGEAVVIEDGELAPDPDAATRPIVHDHVLRIGVGVGLPLGMGGLAKGNREAVFELGATGRGDSAATGSFRVEYRRDLLAVRLAIQGKQLVIGQGSRLDVFDGVEDQAAIVRPGGGFLSLAALAGIQWEPTLYTAGDGGEGLSIALSALGGYEHTSVWGAFSRERVPNFRFGQRSFHWIVERLRLDAEVALRWRHLVGGETIRHLLGLEAGLAGTVHIPYLSYASEAIAGVEDVWGSWMVFVRMTWEIGLPDLE